MTSTSSRHGIGSKAFDVLVAAGLVSGLLCITTSAQQPAATAPSSSSAVEPHLLSPEERRKREEWQRSISRIPAPNKGCFKSSYPSLEWHEVPCGPPPRFRHPPGAGPRPDVVGYGRLLGPVSSAAGAS
jgi:hypothetical protein